MTKTGLALAALVLAVAIATGAQADERPCGRVPVQDWMNEAELRERVALLDLRIEEIDIEDGCYVVEARDAEDREFEILLHPQTGEAVRIDG